MKRSELEHLIRAAGRIAGDREIVVIGSQACLEVHDLAISKYAAGREKDLEFTRELARHEMTDKRTLLKRLAATRLTAALAKIMRGRIERDFSSPRG